MAGESSAVSWSAHCASAAHALNPTQTVMYPSPNISTASRPPRSARLECAAANRSSTGAAAPAIMPTIITAHMVNVKNTSATVHDMSIAMPISAIIVSCSIEDAI